MVSFNPDGNNLGAEKIFKAIQKTYDDNKALRILNELVEDLEMDDDSDTSYYDDRSGSADLRRQRALQEQLANMSESDKKEMYKRYAKKQAIDRYRYRKPGPLNPREIDKLRLARRPLQAIEKIATKTGAPLAAVTTAGEAAANRLIGPAATSMGSKALGFMGNPLLATLAGMFAPTQMGDGTLYTPEEMQEMYEQRQRELALSGPLAF